MIACLPCRPCSFVVVVVIVVVVVVMVAVVVVVAAAVQASARLCVSVWHSAALALTRSDRDGGAPRAGPGRAAGVTA